MGIEPTMPLLAQSIIGFEDRGRHQIGARFRRGNYSEIGELPTASGSGERQRSGNTATLVDKLRQALGCLMRIAVLPDPHDKPARSSQPTVCFAVAAHGPGDLRRPPGTILLHGTPVALAPVPEATIDEYGDACANENDVRITSQIIEDAAMYPVAQTAGIERMPE